MADINVDPPTAYSNEISQRSMELRKFEARMGVLKVAIGTALVGLASVLVPGAIQFWDLQFKSWREAEVLDIQRAQNRQTAISEFVDSALNEDIEHRLRLAEYFAVISHEEADRVTWKAYFDELEERRERTKAIILGFEAESNAILFKPVDQRTQDEVIKLVTLKLQLDWHYGELGRAIRGESVVATANERRDLANTQSDGVETLSSLRPISGTAGLHADFRRKLSALVSDLQAEGLPFEVFEGFRSPERQAYMFAQGRTIPGAKVTWVQPWGSTHNYGVAADLVLKIDGEWLWDDTGERAEMWERMHQLAGSHGLTGLYSSQGRRIENPHVQLKNIDISGLRAGQYPEGGDRAWAINLQTAILGWDGPAEAPPSPISVAQPQRLQLDDTAPVSSP